MKLSNMISRIASKIRLRNLLNLMDFHRPLLHASIKFVNNILFLGDGASSGNMFGVVNLAYVTSTKENFC